MIYAGSTSTVRLIANTPGKPFTLSPSVTTAGDGDVTHTASSQAATGPEWWDNGDNWDGGSVPAAGDDIILADSNVGFKYGLPTNLELRAGSLHIYQSFTGWLGLPKINRDNPAKPYPEYRTRYPVFEDGDGVTEQSVDIVIGLGNGTGSPLLNIEYDAQHADAESLWTIYNTGTPQANISDYALNIATDATSNDNDFKIHKGSVAIGRAVDGKAAQVASVVIAFASGQASDVNLLLDKLTGTLVLVNQNGGMVEVTENCAAAVTLWEMNAGVTHHRGGGIITAADINKGTFYPYLATITTLTIGQFGVVDCNRSTLSSMLFVNVDMYAGAQFIDDNDRASVTNGPDLVRCGLEDVVLRRGKHLRVTKGAVS